RGPRPPADPRRLPEGEGHGETRRGGARVAGEPEGQKRPGEDPYAPLQIRPDGREVVTSARRPGKPHGNVLVDPLVLGLRLGIPLRRALRVSQGKRYVVTGGAGFIGANIAEALRGSGERARILDNVTTGRREKLAARGHG